MSKDSATATDRQAAALSRKSTIWGVAHAVVALALIIYAFASDGEVSWFILSGLFVAIAAGALYFMAGRALKQSTGAGRGRIIGASLLALNWLAVVSFLSLFSAIMHPEATLSSGLANIVIGLFVPLAHLIGNFWFLVAGLNIDTGKWAGLDAA
jgi:hypothetical protein